MAVVQNYISLSLKWMLQKVFGFDRWHVSAVAARPYAGDIIHYANARENRQQAVEIGCGLGDIIRNIRYERRLGLDNSRKVLRAASFLGGPFQPHLRFQLFQFPESELTGRFDLLIMVNWIHHIEPITLKAKLENYFTLHLSGSGEIIIDTVQDPDYKYNHDIYFLTGAMDARVTEVGKYSRQRQIWSIQKTK